MTRMPSLDAMNVELRHSINTSIHVYIYICTDITQSQTKVAMATYNSKQFGAEKLTP